MKTVKSTLLMTMAVALVWAFSSCGTSNFKGYYPENRITGKGIGRPHDNTAQTSPDANTANTSETVVATTEPTVEPTPAITPVEAQKTAEEVLKENKFVRIFMPNLITYTRVAAVDNWETEVKKLPWTQRLNARIFGRVYRKQAEKMGAAGMSTGDIFAIVSLGAGGLAFLYYSAFLFGVGAIVMGILALKRGTSRRGMAIAGIALGAVALVLWTSLLVWWGVRGYRRL